MFDRITVAPPARSTTTYVEKTVVEKRAPTDDSVRLLREMEEASRRQVIEAINVGDTAFQCVVHYQQRMMDNKDELVAIFSLNGRKMEARFSQDSGARHMQMRWRQSLVEGLIAKVAETIATEILCGALGHLQEHPWSSI